MILLVLLLAFIAFGVGVGACYYVMSEHRIVARKKGLTKRRRSNYELVRKPISYDENGRRK